MHGLQPALLSVQPLSLSSSNVADRPELVPLWRWQSVVPQQPALDSPPFLDGLQVRGNNRISSKLFRNSAQSARSDRKHLDENDLLRELGKHWHVHARARKEWRERKTRLQES